MVTQKVITSLGGHEATLKQIKFQPGINNNSVLATSSRDGTVHIWDIRCAPEERPIFELRGVNARMRDNPPWSRSIMRITDAHKSSSLHPASCAGPERSESISVTCMAFLAQQHLLATGSEQDSKIKLWDLRSLNRSARSETQLSVSETAYPEYQSKWRHYGTTSLSLSGDGSRLFALSKDNIVLTYSTAHMILGHAPQLSQTDPNGRRFPPTETKQGLGPMYGYRHPKLLVSGFYVKTAIRKASGDKCEMLAVGSSHACIILFPTDEIYLPKNELNEDPTPESRPTSSHCSTQRVSSYRSRRPADSMPVSYNGTALIRGHEHEVNAVSWSSEGNLISVSDDLKIRVWRDDNDNEDARDLREGGEASGRRWNCGWADVTKEYDDTEWSEVGKSCSWK